METRQFPPELTPVGEHTWEKEPFADWWGRCGPALSNLHALIAEQWIYRHFSYTSFSSLALNRLIWRLERWSAETIISGVLMPGNDLYPQYDFEVFAGRDQTDTGTPFLNSGTWDYPIITLCSSSGFATWEGDFPSARLLLIEGHQRMRMLNAMHALQKPLQTTHEVFVLELPDV